MSNEPLITKELLKQWDACASGYARFNELFPDGAELQTAIDGLVADGHDDWGVWLFGKCRDNGLYSDFVSKGYQSTGNWNSGDQNTGSRNTGNRNSGNWNSGNQNSGNWNSGNQNTGNRNTGYQNTGNRNTGNQNTGNWNSGNWNSGNWNSGNQNTGNFNTATPEDILIFNKPCRRYVWESSKKPQFIFFDINVWISESEMTDQEKIDNKTFFTTGGYLKTIPYKDAFKASWDKASPEDRALIKQLPNFDADVFFEISGIRVD